MLTDVAVGKNSIAILVIRENIEAREKGWTRNENFNLPSLV